PEIKTSTIKPDISIIMSTSSGCRSVTTWTLLLNMKVTDLNLFTFKEGVLNRDVVENTAVGSKPNALPRHQLLSWQKACQWLRSRARSSTNTNRANCSAILAMLITSTARYSSRSKAGRSSGNFMT